MRSASKVILFSACALFPFLTTFALQEKNVGIISGYVRDRATHTPLVGVNIILVGTKSGSASGRDGAFKITNVSPGLYSLKASLIGYEQVVKTDIVVRANQQSEILFELSETSVMLDEVTVQSSYFSRPQELATSSHTLSFEEVRRSPGAAGDVSRVMLSLPGVVFNTDLRNDLIVRGGSPAENYVSVDHLEIPTINHFSTQGATGGPIGMIHTELIRDVTFLTGGFPAKYGDRLSSVMEIELREGNRDRLSGKMNVNAAGFSLLGEGPMTERGSWILSLRRSYLDFLLKNFNFSGITIVPNYYDGQMKLSYQPSTNDRLTMLFIGGVDDVKFQGVDIENMGTNPGISGVDKLKNDQNQYLFGGTWKRIWGESGFTVMSLSTTRNYFFTDIDDDIGKKTYNNESIEREYVAKIDGSFNLSKGNQISFGIGARAIFIAHDVFLKSDTSKYVNLQTGSGIFPELDYDKRFLTYKLFGYLQYNRWLFNRWSFIPGIRVDYFDYVEKGFSISPRFSVRYYVDEKTSFNSSVGIYYQTPAYLWLTVDEVNRYLRPIRSDHFILGFEHLIKDDLRFTIDVYRKLYKYYPVSGYIPSYILVNGGADAGAFIAGNLMSLGSGNIDGVELFLQKKLTNNYYGTISYSFSRSSYKALDNIERPGRFDYGHVLTVVGGYKFSPAVEASIKWRYAGGNPYTPIDIDRSEMFGRELMDINQIYAVRYPSYHRLDVRMDYRFSIGSYQAVTYLDLQNAYNRKNFYYYVWNNKSARIVSVYQWSLLPIFGFSLEF